MLKVSARVVITRSTYKPIKNGAMLTMRQPNATQTYIETKSMRVLESDTKTLKLKSESVSENTTSIKRTKKN